MSKLRLCVIFGGNSPEYEISLISAASVLENLNQDTYQISKIGITREGEWFLCDADPAAIRENRWQRSRCRHALISPDSKVHGIVAFDDQGYEQIPLDVVFPVLHGEHGEDGAIQGLLELAGIAYVGPGGTRFGNVYG